MYALYETRQQKGTRSKRMKVGTYASLAEVEAAKDRWVARQPKGYNPNVITYATIEYVR